MQHVRMNVHDNENTTMRCCYSAVGDVLVVAEKKNCPKPSNCYIDTFSGRSALAFGCFDHCKAIHAQASLFYDDHLLIALANAVVQLCITTGAVELQVYFFWKPHQNQRIGVGSTNRDPFEIQCYIKI